MSFRGRLALASALAVVIAVALASIGAYFIVRDELRDGIDRALRARAAVITRAPEPNNGPRAFGRRQGRDVQRERAIRRALRELPPPRLGGAGGSVQLVDSTGATLLASGGDPSLPVGARTLAVAGGGRDVFFEDATVEGTHVRVLTKPLVDGIALQLARPLDEVDRVLADLRLILLLVLLGSVVLAGGLGLLVSRTALAPVRQLTQTAEHIAETQDLSRRIQTTGRDEVSRLGTTFNTMLGVLEDSQRAQRQLVLDASHELRTPLTSLRTNIELLAREDTLDKDDYEETLNDVTMQLEELTTLVADVVELARGAEPDATAEVVNLGELVAGAVDRASRHAPQVRFVTHLDDSTVVGIPRQLDRAIANLLDNAAKWSPAGGTVEVSTRDGEVVVRDHGCGIAPADLPHVFDHFYRSPEARGLPGSGLGLAIVRKVAEAHSGTAVAEHAEGGGALLRFRLATSPP